MRKLFFDYYLRMNNYQKFIIMQNMKWFFLAVMAITIIFPSCEEDELFPSLSDLQVCTSINSDFQCDSNASQFDTTTPEINASVVINDASPDNEVTFVWTFVDSDLEIDAVTYSLSNLDKSDRYQIASFLSIPNNGWPTGNYQVEVFLDDVNTSSIARQFSIQ